MNSKKFINFITKHIFFIILGVIMVGFLITRFMGSTFAAPTHQQTVTGTSMNSATVVSATVTGGTNRLYIVSVNIRGGTIDASISGLGLTWILQKRQCSGRNNQSVAIWTAFGSPSSGTVTANLTGTALAAVISVSSYTNVDSANPVSGVNGSNTNGQNSTTCSGGVDDTSPTLNMSTTVADSVIYVATGSRGQTLSTIQTGYTERASAMGNTSGNAARLTIHDKTRSSAGSETITHGAPIAIDWVMAGIAIRPAVAASPTPTNTPVPTATATPVPGLSTIYPTEDTFDKDSSPATNYCTYDHLEVDFSGPTQTAYLKFDLSAYAGQTITNATLNMYVTNGSGGTQNIKSISNDTWSACTLTYNNKPTLGSVISTFSAGGTANVWKTASLTSQVQSEAGGVLSIAIDQTSTDGYWFSSEDDAAFKPYLQITATSPTPTRTPTPTLTPTPGPTLTPTPILSPTPVPVGANLDQVNSIYSYSGLGFYTLSTSFDGNRTEGKDVTVFLISGSLEIKENFEMTDPQDSVTFIVNGNIYVDPNVTRIPGVYISSQTFTVAASENPLVIDGMIYAKKLNLARLYYSQTEPTYQINYQPKYIIDLLPYLGRTQVNWQEVR